MTAVHGPVTRAAIANEIGVQADIGSAAAKIVLRTVDDEEVATLTCSDPAGAAAGEVFTFSAITSDTSATGGLATKATVEDSDSNTILTLTVGLIGSGADLEFDVVDIVAASTVAITFLSYTAPV